MQIQSRLFALAIALIAPCVYADSSTITIVGTQDLSARINAADARLGDRAGVIEVTDAGKIRETLHLSPKHILRFGAGEWHFTAAPGIVVSDADQIVGVAPYLTTLQYDAPNGDLIVSKDFEVFDGMPEKSVLEYPTKDKKLKQVGGTKYVKISNLTLSGDPKSKQRTGVRIYGFWLTFSDVSVENFPGDGIMTEYVASGKILGNDATESFFSHVKLLNNGGNGWTVRGPHDSIVNGMIVAKNGGWGIDVQHRDGYYSGGGLMLTNVHAYANKAGGIRTAHGANILAYAIESEANHGPGVVLRSNDNYVQGEIYTNAGTGIQIGEAGAYSGVNTINVQLHNNRTSQIDFVNTAGGNHISGAIYASGTQKYFGGEPSNVDVINASLGGLDSVAIGQRYQGGMRVDTSGTIWGAKIGK